jgi:hypothetical protein
MHNEAPNQWGKPYKACLTRDLTPPGTAMTLVTLQTKPCGCIAAIYRARPTDVEVELVEAKGPHCRFFRHQPGQVISLGVPEILDSEGTEPRV